MLKRLTAWLLVFSVLTVNYSRLFVYAGFKLNQSYIAANLCVNRNKPQVRCEGKCYLAKKVKEADSRQNNAERGSQKNLLQEAYCENKTSIKFYTRLLQELIIANDHPALPSGHNSIFRPPQLG